MRKSSITDILSESAELKAKLVSDENLQTTIDKVCDTLIDCFKSGGKVLFCGNGGSASDAQHIAAELSGRFYLDRAPLFAEALHVNTSYLTAVANDYSYDHIYERAVESKGKAGDVLIGLSTSGTSSNVLKALAKAKELDMITIGFCGSKTGAIDPLCDHLIAIPSSVTPRIQECHILVGHIICEIVEKELFS